MKKLLTIASISVLAFAASAQGFISFNNSSSAATKISTNSVVGGAATGLGTIGSGNYFYELFASTSATANGSASSVMPIGIGQLGTYVFSDVNWTDIANAQSGITRAGQVSGAASVTVPAGAGGGGASDNFVVVGWSANIGTTISALQTYLANPTALPGGAFVGQSNVGNVALGNGTSLPTLAVFGNGVNGFTLGIVPVPEPSTMALAGLGGLAALLFRRRK